MSLLGSDDEPALHSSLKNIVVVNVRRDGISTTNENNIPGAY